MKHITIVSIALVLLAGGYAGAQQSLPVGAPARFHTRIVQISGPSDTQLNQLGDQGWEVKGFSPCAMTGAVGNGSPSLNSTCVILQQRY